MTNPVNNANFMHHVWEKVPLYFAFSFDTCRSYGPDYWKMLR